MSAAKPALSLMAKARAAVGIWQLQQLLCMGKMQQGVA
jgi:hypothetical protein